MSQRFVFVAVGAWQADDRPYSTTTWSGCIRSCAATSPCKATTRSCCRRLMVGCENCATRPNAKTRTSTRSMKNTDRGSGLYRDRCTTAAAMLSRARRGCLTPETFAPTLLALATGPRPRSLTSRGRSSPGAAAWTRRFSWPQQRRCSSPAEDISGCSSHSKPAQRKTTASTAAFAASCLLAAEWQALARLQRRADAANRATASAAGFGGRAVVSASPGRGILRRPKSATEGAGYPLSQVGAESRPQDRGRGGCAAHKRGPGVRRRLVALCASRTDVVLPETGPVRPELSG